MKAPPNIYGSALTVIAMAMLLLGGTRISSLQYFAFGLLIFTTGMMAYLYRKVISERPSQDSDIARKQASRLSPDKEDN